MTNFVMKAITAAQTQEDEENINQINIFQQTINSMMNRQIDGDPAEMVEKLREIGATDFALEEPASQEARRIVREEALEGVRKAVTAFHRVPGGYDYPNGYERAFRATMFAGEDAAQNDVKNKAFLWKVNSPDPVVKHEAFLELMDRFADADPERWGKYNDADLAKKAESIMPLAIMAFEEQNLLSYFKSQGVPVTPEEEKRWKTITGKIGEATTHVTGRLNQICNPYYPVADFNKLPQHDPQFWQDTVNLLQGEADDYCSDAMMYHNATTEVTVVNGIFNLLGRENLPSGPNGYTINYAPTFDTETPDGQNYSAGAYEKDAFDGKVLYVFDNAVRNQLVNAEKERLRSEGARNKWSDAKLQKELDNTNGILKRVSDTNPDKFFCVQDLAGNGVYTRVPAPVKKPNRFLRLLHNIGKAFGGTGRKDCNRYDEYEKQISELRKQAEKRSPFDDFNKACTEQRQAHAPVVDASEKIDRVRVATQEAEERFTSFLGSVPRDNATLLKRGVYQPGDLDLTRYELPADFTEEEFATAAFAALADTELTKDCRGTVPGLNEEECSKQSYLHITEDLLYKSDMSSREQSGQFIRPFGAARKAAKDALDAYAAGDKEPLAKLLGNSIPRQTGNATVHEKMSNITYEAAKCLDRELKLLGRDPQLLELSGLKPEELQNAQAAVKLGELYKNQLTAGVMLKDAADGKRDLSQQERQRCLEDALLYQLVEHMERMERIRFETSDPMILENQAQVDELAKDQSVNGRELGRKELPEEEKAVFRAKIKENTQRIEALQLKQNMRRWERPQSALLRSISDPVNGPAAMEQLRQSIRSSDVMQELSTKSITEQMILATEKGGDQTTKNLYQKLFPPRANAQMQAPAGAHQRGNEAAQEKNEGVNLV